MTTSIRDALRAELTDKQRRDYDALEKAILEKYVRRRVKDDETSPFILDQRNEVLGFGGRRGIVGKP